MHRTISAFALGTTLSIAALAGCGAAEPAADRPDGPMPPVSTAPPAGTPTLSGTRWVQVDGPGRFELDGQRYSASVGCNRIGGDAVVNGSTLTFTTGQTTLMACQDLMAAEEALQRDLGAVASYRLADGRLLWLDRTGATLRVFAPERDAPLAGTWNLAGFASEGTVSSQVTDTSLSITIAADGTVSGSDGCNRIMGTTSTDQPAPAGRAPLRFGPLAGTKRACDAAIMAQAATFTSALARTAGWSTQGTTLSLYDTSGTLVASFTSA